MEAESGRQEWVLRRRNRLFWLFFAITGALIALRLPFTELALGITVILLGIYKIGSELEHKKLVAELDQAKASVVEMGERTVALQKQLQSIGAKVDARFFAMDKKRMSSEKKILQSYRQAVRSTGQLKKSVDAMARAIRPRARRGRRPRVRVDVQ